MKLWKKFRQWLNGVGGAFIPELAHVGTDTEFSAEVVRITRILPHPNADRLEIARFEMKGLGETSYEVVIQKGSFQAGDLAAYFSVDCILPTINPAFKFLTDRPDGKDKAFYRLRAARIRGIFSQGLLVPAPNLPDRPLSGCQLGDQVADYYGVVYHRDEVEPESGGAGPKKVKHIQVQSMPVYSIDNLKKNPRLFVEGEAVYISEKIHGTNIRFGWVKCRGLWGLLGRHRFVVGSHRVIKGQGSGRDWYGEDLWSRAAEGYELAARTRRFPGYVFYGELFGYTYSGTPIQDLVYGRSKCGPGLVIFDVKTPTGWMGPRERRLFLEVVGHDAPASSTTWHPYSLDFVKQIAEGYSFLDSGTVMEGVVVESATGRKKAKYVSERYLTRKVAA